MKGLHVIVPARPRLGRLWDPDRNNLLDRGVPVVIMPTKVVDIVEMENGVGK